MRVEIDLAIGMTSLQQRLALMRNDIVKAGFSRRPQLTPGMRIRFKGGLKKTSLSD
jgi:hypothetical protein